MSGSIPNSRCCIFASYIGLAEKRTDQPLGSSEEKGRPEPPPVLSPMMVTLGSIFILFTKSLVALKERRLVSTTACFCQRTRSSDGSSQTALGVEKSLCPGPVLWDI